MKGKKERNLTKKEKEEGYYEEEEKIGNWYRFSNEQLNFFKDCKPVKVCCLRGDMVLFDSRCIHYASQPTSNNVRMVVYVSMSPASQATKADIEKKKKAFKEKRMTTHYAARNVILFPENPRTYGNQALIDNFKVDKTKLPELSERGRKLAGLDPWL
jgi:ectoine hydroxylase-related dioxygenase (phytanoyl-CoA dioxygenase family)